MINRRVSQLAIAGFFATCVIFHATAASAQTVGAGIKAGINVNTISFDEETGIDLSSRKGLVAGVFVTVPVAGRFSFQPELLISARGAELSEIGGPGTATLKMSYVEVPLLGSVRLTQGNSPVSLLVGPSIAFRTQAQIEEEGGETTDFKEETTSTDFGLVTGLAIGVGRNLVIDGRYTWGLKNINTDETEEAGRNRTLSVTIGWRFK